MTVHGVRIEALVSAFSVILFSTFQVNAECCGLKRKCDLLADVIIYELYCMTYQSKILVKVNGLSLENADVHRGRFCLMFICAFYILWSKKKLTSGVFGSNIAL